MKIRSNFVSNSSSASFIIHWEYLDADLVNIEEAFANLFEIYHLYDEDDRKVNWHLNSNEWNKKYEKIYKELVSKTQDCGNNRFKSDFFTSMYNDCDDFGESALKLLFLLTVKPSFRVINAKIDSDND